MGTFRSLITDLAARLRRQRPRAHSTAPMVERLEDRRLLSASSGAVYALSNATSGNEIEVFARARDGSLTMTGSVSTGGLGIGDGSDGEGLQSQGALRRFHQYLYAVNGGSGDISVFTIGSKGLTLVQRIASGGDVPISLTARGNTLYVLNYDRLAASPDTGNITGFRIGKHGQLTALAGSTQSLGGVGTNPGEVAFTPSGRVLVVSEKATDQIATYTVSKMGVASAPTLHASGGDFPFAVAFGAHNVVVEVDDFNDAVGAAAASSFIMSAGGSLQLVSAGVPDHQTAACWIVVSKNGKFAYVINTNVAVISAYRIAADGTLSLVNADGMTATIAGTKPRDAALSADGRFLNVLNSGSGTVETFRIHADGSLTSLGAVGAIPAPGANGLAAL